MLIKWKKAAKLQTKYLHVVFVSLFAILNDTSNAADSFLL